MAFKPKMVFHDRVVPSPFLSKQKKLLWNSMIYPLSVELLCYYCQVHSDPEWLYLLWSSFMGQIDTFKNYLYRIVCKGKTFKQFKNVNINMQWTWFPKVYVWNNPMQVDMPLKSIISTIHNNFIAIITTGEEGELSTVWKTLILNLTI